MKILERQPSEKARSYAIRVLLYNITALELPPGSSVSENEVSSVMNISRTPVREALIELSRMDLVLETAIVKLACEQGISSYYMELLEKNLRQESSLSNTQDFSVQLELDNHFHQLLFESVGKSRTFDIIYSQMIHFDRLRILSLKSWQDARVVKDHQNILYAIRQKDSELAEMLITRHLTRFQVEKAELTKRYPDYFTL